VVNNEKGDGTSKTEDVDIVWVEGLVPGIDFCNHGISNTCSICVLPYSFHEPKYSWPYSTTIPNKFPNRNKFLQ